uniref:Uncharacterized protein n=1 Tax=Arundo donax TaxID=35708 RepID=A0A0A9BUA7_ARUDO
MEMEMSVGTRNLPAHSCASRNSFDTLAATHDMSGRANGSLPTHRSASAVSDSAASTGNESLSLRSTHRRIASPPSAAAASAASISDVRSYSPVALFTSSYRTGSCPDSSSRSTTPSANTSERREGGPPAMSSGAMYPRVPSIRLPRLPVRRCPEPFASSSSFWSAGSSPARSAAPKWAILAWKRGPSPQTRTEEAERRLWMVSAWRWT